MSAAPDLLGLPKPRLAEVLAPVVDRPYRVEQIYRAVNLRGVASFDEITDLPRELRSRLTADFRLAHPRRVDARRSADGTVKVLFELGDGATVEAVDIPDAKRRTFCISSQSGCPLGCKFCVTGYWGAGRNLSPGEIVGQVLALRGAGEKAESTAPPAGLNLVFMGMGEPLLNLDAVEQAIEVLAETISRRRMTLSTVGLLAGLERMARWSERPNLAISLHAPDDERRSKIMPINRTQGLNELMAFLKDYPLERGRRITFEYILIRGFNDAVEDAAALVRLLHGLKAKVNLIPLNEDPVLGPSMVSPTREAVEAFQQRLRRGGLVATVRRQRGDEVSGACGQLRAFGREPRGFRTPVTL